MDNGCCWLRIGLLAALLLTFSSSSAVAGGGAAVNLNADLHRRLESALDQRCRWLSGYLYQIPGTGLYTMNPTLGTGSDFAGCGGQYVSGRGRPVLAGTDSAGGGNRPPVAGPDQADAGHARGGRDDRDRCGGTRLRRRYAVAGRSPARRQGRRGVVPPAGLGGTADPA